MAQELGSQGGAGLVARSYFLVIVTKVNIYMIVSTWALRISEELKEKQSN
jgi:hypothetical protein